MAHNYEQYSLYIFYKRLVYFYNYCCDIRIVTSDDDNDTLEVLPFTLGPDFDGLQTLLPRQTHQARIQQMIIRPRLGILSFPVGQ